ncbi:hypothetical protein, partial [uncultured Alistipes sp.]|uniref:hypothetical protein n=1 Tax=uncultured Alistipes sp. TaxID=538949 RepID=UPI0032209815
TVFQHGAAFLLSFVQQKTPLFLTPRKMGLRLRAATDSRHFTCDNSFYCIKRRKSARFLKDSKAPESHLRWVRFPAANVGRTVHETIPQSKPDEVSTDRNTVLTRQLIQTPSLRLANTNPNHSISWLLNLLPNPHLLHLLKKIITV